MENGLVFWTGVLASCTFILAVATAAMAYQAKRSADETKRLADESTQASFRQIGVQTWLELVKRFESPEMLKARKKLAQQLRQKPTPNSDDISDTVACFFEDLGTLYKFKHINEDLANSSFSIHVTFYWEALREQISIERRKYDGNSTLFEYFEHLATEERKKTHDKINQQLLEQFLDDEAKIVVQ